MTKYIVCVFIFQNPSISKEADRRKWSRNKKRRAENERWKGESGYAACFRTARMFIFVSYLIELNQWLFGYGGSLKWVVDWLRDECNLGFLHGCVKKRRERYRTWAFKSNVTWCIAWFVLSKVPLLV